MQRRLILELSLIVIAVTVSACKRDAGGDKSELKTNGADAKANSLEYSSATVATLDAGGQLLLPGLRWSGTHSVGSSRYEILPVE